MRLLLPRGQLVIKHCLRGSGLGTAIGKYGRSHHSYGIAPESAPDFTLIEFWKTFLPKSNYISPCLNKAISPQDARLITYFVSRRVQHAVQV